MYQWVCELVRNECCGGAGADVATYLYRGIRVDHWAVYRRRARGYYDPGQEEAGTDQKLKMVKTLYGRKTQAN